MTTMMHTQQMDMITSPSPFTSGPLTTRFSSFPYRNFSPSHFTDNSAPSLGAVQSTYAQTAGAHLSEPLMVTTSVSSPGIVFDAVPHAVPQPQAWSHTPLQTTDDLAAYLEHRTRLAQQQ